MLKTLKSLAVLFWGGSIARGNHARDRAQASDYHNNIVPLAELIKADERFLQESPIFVFSAGWRSGSTLLQRLICSEDTILLWGEPYDRSNIIQSLADTLSPFSEHWPPKDYYEKINQLDNLAESWIANLYPHPKDMLDAYRATLDTLFMFPAKRLSATRWGIKEVRFGAKEALFLQLLYPNAKFIFLQRNVFQAYKSYKNFSPFMDWYAKWPARKAFTPYAFARHRRRLVNEFNAVKSHVNALTIEYDDLVKGHLDLQALADFCAIKINPDLLNKKVGSGDNKHSSTVKPLTKLETWLLRLGDR